jgi:hypothetical protein
MSLEKSKLGLYCETIYDINNTFNNTFSEEDEKHLFNLSNNFIVYYYSSNMSIHENNINLINRAFNMYIKNVFETNVLSKINDIFNFINNINYEEDIYNLKSYKNISNIIKYIKQYNSILIYNVELCDNLIELMLYIYDQKLKVKSNVFYNIIDICYYNFNFINNNYSNILIDYKLKHENIYNYEEKHIIKVLNLEVYNKLLYYTLYQIKDDKLWLNKDYINKCRFILSCTKYLYKDLVILFNKQLYKYLLISYDDNNFITNGLIQKKKIKLRNLIINYNKSSIKNAIRSFIDTYDTIIDNFIYNKNDFNLLIDGRNTFYSKKDINNIDLLKIKNFDKNIKDYIRLVNNNLINKNIINSNDNRKYNVYLIFNENHKNVLDTLKLQNSIILYTPSGTDDDIIQLYLWISFLGCILISNDKHSNYINRINDNKYYYGLFMEYKSLFQIKL